MIVWCHEYNQVEKIGKYSLGIGFPICKIKDEEIISSKFIGDADDALYDIEVGDKLKKRMEG